MHTPRINALIKGEGDIEGRLFELTGWRRDGLLARLRERGFEVRTWAISWISRQGRRPPRRLLPGLAAARHRYRADQPLRLRGLRWHPLTPETRDGASGVTMYDGWVLRRRKGRSASSFYLAFRERGGGIGLRPLTRPRRSLATPRR